MKSKLTLILVGVLSVFVTVILLLYASESYLRIQARRNPPPLDGWDAEGNLYTWGHRVTGMYFEHKKPGQPSVIRGYRQLPFAKVKPARQFRVLVLGDSYTFGEGIAQEDMYVNRLKHKLQEAHPKRDIEVINFGLRGADTKFQAFILETSVDQLKPDVVVVGFTLNDPKQSGDLYSPERERFYATYGSQIKRSLAGLSKIGLSLTAQRMKQMIENLLPRLGIAPDWPARLARAYDPSGKEWREFIQALGDIKKRSDQRQLPKPYFAVLTASLDHAAVAHCHQAEEAAKSLGYRTLNYEKEIRAGFEDAPMRAPWGGHASKELNEVYAQKLSSLINADMSHYDRRKLVSGSPRH